jgi:hypothetical protein
MILTQDTLKDMFDYREDGNLIRKHATMGNGNYAGKTVGWADNKGYVSTKIHGASYRVHRLIWMWHYGELPEQLDHINGCKSDNRIENLRLASNSENMMNRKTFKNNSSGCKGVSWHQKNQKWFVYVDVNKRRKNIGYFDDLELAELVATEAREKYHGKFANFF